MFKHILVPTDFGAPAQHALDVAIELASKFEAKVTILHAYQFVIPLPYTEAINLPLLDLSVRAQKMLDDTVASAVKRYGKCEGRLGPGAPSEEIVQAIREVGADLIVMGTHGRRGLSRAILGSTTERMVRISPVPVLTVGAS